MYPLSLRTPNGNAICLPYLAALIRLADEIDITAAHNPILLYDIESLTEEIAIIESKKVKAIRSLRITEKDFVLTIGPSDGAILVKHREMTAKMKSTLDFCRAAVCGRMPYVITQERVLIVEEP